MGLGDGVAVNIVDVDSSTPVWCVNKTNSYAKSSTVLYYYTYMHRYNYYTHVLVIKG